MGRRTCKTKAKPNINMEDFDESRHMCMRAKRKLSLPGRKKEAQIKSRIGLKHYLAELYALMEHPPYKRMVEFIKSLLLWEKGDRVSGG